VDRYSAIAITCLFLNIAVSTFVLGTISVLKLFYYIHLDDPNWHQNDYVLWYLKNKETVGLVNKVALGIKNSCEDMSYIFNLLR
jgi:hypothetical protein